MDGIVLLQNNYKLVKRLFKEFENTKDSARPAAKEKLVQQICTELTRHAFFEKTIFYPAARSGAPATGDPMLESIEEHHVVAWLVSELRDLDASDDAKTTVLIEHVRHHVSEEETERFSQVRKARGRNRPLELGEQIAAARSSGISGPLALVRGQELTDPGTGAR